MPVNDWQTSDLRANVVLDDGQVRLRGLPFPVNTGVARTRVSTEGVAVLESLRVRALSAGEAEPPMNLEMAATMPLDSRVVNLQKLGMTLNLSEQVQQRLPQELQEALGTYALDGKLTLQAFGRLPLDDWTAMKLDAVTLLEEGYVAIDETQLPIDSLQANLSVEGRAWPSVPMIEVRTMGGQVEVSGAASLTKPGYPGAFDIRLQDIRIEQTLRAMSQEDEEPAYSGRLSGKIRFEAPLLEAMRKADGGGTIQLRKARVANLPIISQLIALVDKATNVPFKPAQGQDRRGRGRRRVHLRRRSRESERFPVKQCLDCRAGRGDNRV